MAETGDTSGGTFASINTGGAIWSNPSNAAASDDTYALCEPNKGAASDSLRVTNFGFSIPAGSTIDGIEVKVERREGNSNDNITDDSVRLVLATVATGDDKASGTEWPTTDTIAAYGGASDDWNAGFDADDINNSTFGMQISTDNTAGSSSNDALIDHITINVTYTGTAGRVMSSLVGSGGLAGDGGIAGQGGGLAG